MIADAGQQVVENGHAPNAYDEGYRDCVPKGLQLMGFPNLSKYNNFKPESPSSRTHSRRQLQSTHPMRAHLLLPLCMYHVNRHL